MEPLTDQMDLHELLKNVDALDETVRRAVEDAMEEHLRHNNKVAAWDGHKVVLVDPEELAEMLRDRYPD
ncbi:MAG: hypothetical protein JST40_08795 [Armatimonadetes bacterium]|nr:hypothetical protein [Armatimonadota bacterium]